MFKIIITSLLTLTLISCSQKSDNVKIVEDYFAAHNSHNVNKTMKFYSKDASFEIPGQDTFKGLEQILEIEEWDAALSSDLEASDFVDNGDTVFVNKIIERNDWFENMGIDSVVYNPGTRIILEKGLIKAMIPSPLLQESRERILTRLEMFVNWAKTIEPEALKSLLPEGKFSYKKENANKWISLLKEWQSYGHHK